MRMTRNIPFVLGVIFSNLPDHVVFRLIPNPVFCHTLEIPNDRGKICGVEYRGVQLSC